MMRKNYFNTIRKSYASVLIVAIMGNIMVFAQPIQQLMAFQPIKPRIVTYNSEVWTEKKVKPSKEEKSSIKPIEVKPEPSVEPKDRPTINTHTFKAMNTLGVIGKKGTGDVESPYDNFFDIEIPESIALEQYQAYIKYELFGLASALSTTKSINGHLSYGGMLIEKDDAWHTVKEPLANHQLQKGKNEIYFTRRADQTYQYQIKNLKLVLEPKTSNSIVVSPIVKTTNGTAYINGFVQDPNIQTIQVTPLEIEIPVVEGRFEYLLHNLPDATKKLHLSFLNESIPLSIEDSTSEGLVTLDHKEPKKSLHAFFVSEQKEQLFSYEALSIDQQNLSGTYPQAGFVVNKLEFKDVRVLNSSLYNVTAGDAPAFRVQKLHLPDSVPVKLHLKFDENKIPQGYSAKDVKTFYYNKNERQWKALPTDSISYQNKSIISRSFSNETDYINGIIKVAESPETSNFTPTTISDMEYANPSAGIVSIAPPTPNSTGSVTTSFPLKLPQGRNGMQPSLSVNYNSEAGNGWMGIGWDIQTPAITINTKWGVPKFDNTYESELYSFNGADLVLKDNDEYTNPHRKADINRNPSSTTRQFYARKEGSYQKIIRHGDDPTKYWWEITDKLGNRSFYGGDENNQVANAIIKTDDNNIVHWALHKTIDNRGNYIIYDYEQLNTTIYQQGLNTVKAKEFYLSNIQYTLNEHSTTNYYQIDFIRDTQTIREDRTISARNGLLQLSEDLLKEIKIIYKGAQDQPIRTYRFEYETAPFNKKQLSKISEYDTNDELFYSNTMEYYNKDANGNDFNINNLYGSNFENFNGSASSQNPLSAVELLLMPSIPSPIALLASGSVLGTSKSLTVSGGLRAGPGLGLNVFSKGQSIGGSFSYERSSQQEIISLIDMNGDGLPDKVFRYNQSLYYYKNNGSGFNSTSIPVFGFDGKLNHTITNTTSKGVDASFFGLSIGKNWSKTRGNTDNYFLDRNGDGLPDLISNNQVYFNKPENISNPSSYDSREFLTGSDDTENEIISGTVDSNIIENLHLPHERELQEENPQFDVVKVWEAPFGGLIDISGNAVMNSIEPINNYTAQYTNKFRFSIEHSNDNSITKIKEVTKTDTSPANMSYNNITVSKGDLIFFRAHNKEYGSGGVVDWNPIINYSSIYTFGTTTSNPSLIFTTENGKSTANYNAKEDFILTSGSSQEATGYDSVEIDFNTSSLNWATNEFTDDIRFKVVRKQYDQNQIEVYSNTWSRQYNHQNGNITGNGGNDNISNLNLNTPTNYRDVFYFYIDSDSNIAWDDILWEPIITLTEGTNSTTYYPPVNHKVYNHNLVSFSPRLNANDFPLPNIITDPQTGLDDGDDPLLVLSHNLDDSSFSDEYMDILNEIGTFHIDLVVKEDKNGIVQVLDKRTYTIELNSGGLNFNPSNVNPITISKNTIDQADNLFIALYCEHETVNRLFENEVPGLPPTPLRPELKLSLVPSEQSQQSWSDYTLTHPLLTHRSTWFGTSYRGWGQFLYNGSIELERDGDDELVYEEDSGGNPVIETYSNQKRPKIKKNYAYNTSNNSTIQLIDITAFPSQDDETNLNGVDQNTEPDDIEDLEIDSNPRYTLYYQDTNHSVGSSKNYKYINEPIGAEYGISTNGNLEEKLGRLGDNDIIASWLNPLTITQTSGVFLGLKQYSISKGDSESGGVPNVSSSFNNSTTKIRNRYVDLNGDRYPDIVTDKKIQYTNGLGGLSEKHLNTVDQDFTVKTINSSTSAGVSIGILPTSTRSDNNDDISPPAYGVNLTDQSIGNPTSTQAGASAGITETENSTKQIYIDMNGDGLPDKVTIEDEGINDILDDIKVNLNLGYDFDSNTILWGSYPHLNNSSGTSLNGGFSFNPDPYGSIAIGTGFQYATSNRNCFFQDINNDGLTDLVYESNGNHRYLYNTGSSFVDLSDSKNLTNENTLNKNLSIAGNVFGSITGGVAFSLLAVNFKFIFTPSIGISNGMSQTNRGFQDIDGDGFPDILVNGQNNSSLDIKKSVLGNQKLHLLKKVHTPLGGSWEVDYERTGNTYDMPQSKWVLNKVETNDGFNGDSAFGPNNTLTEVSYENPKYDRRERSFFGFEKVTVTQKDVTQSGNPTYRYSETEYHNNNYYLKGAPKSVKTFDGAGNILSSKETKYNLLNPDAPQVDLNANASTFYIEYTHASNNNPETLIDQSRLFVAPVRSITRAYEGSQNVAAIEEFLKYDEFGNLEVYRNYGQGVDDIYTTSIGYTTPPNTGNGYAPGYPNIIQVRHGTSASGTVLRERNTDYSQGKMIEIRTKLNTNDENTVNFEYDNLGNLTKVISQDSKEDYSNSSSPSFFKTIEYDHELYTFPTKVSNSYGESSEIEYNYLFGVPIVIKSIIGTKIRTRYDDRGRIIEVSKPTEYQYYFSDEWTIRKEYKGENPLDTTIAAGSPLYIFNAHGSYEANTPYSSISNNNQHYAVTRHLLKKLNYNYPWSSQLSVENELLTVSIVDGFGKALQVKKTHQYSTNNTLVWQVSGKNKVDAFGRVIESYLPTIQLPNNIINPTGTDLEYDNSIPSGFPSLVMEYDEKDRKTAITQPGETTATTLLYEVENGMLKQTLTNEAGQTNTIFTDNRGRKRKTVQNNEITTTFDYNAINELVKVTNTMGYLTNSIYDMAGRRVEIQHPDQGVTKLKYDTAGNLIERETSNLLVGVNPGKITYDYTYNRLLGINYPNNPENNVRYIKGFGDRVMLQKDGSGLQFFQYDKLGNIKEVSRVVNVAGRRGVWFRTNWIYDNWNRVHEIRYPDDEEVRYYYNDAGKVYKVTSDASNGGSSQAVEIVSNIFYNQFGERERIEYGNGTFTNYDYDIRRRLDEVEHTFSGGNQILKKEYTYDILSNIKKIMTANPTGSLPGIGQLGGPAEHHYTYDNYNRLISAHGFYVGPNDENLGSPDFLKQQYELQMEYDKSHNIISKTQTHGYDRVANYTAPIYNPLINENNHYRLKYEDYAQGAYVAGDNYGYVQPHAPRTIIEMPDDTYEYQVDHPKYKEKVIEYDHNGNQTEIKQIIRKEETSNEIVLRKNLWDEENRLTAVDLDPENEHMHPVAVYVYDANGERIIKYNTDRMDTYSNAESRNLADRQNIMIYPSGLLVAKVLPYKQDSEEPESGKMVGQLDDSGPEPEPDPDYRDDFLLKYTNYYYIGSERIGSRLGTSKRKLGWSRWHGLINIEVYDEPQPILIQEYADNFLVSDAASILTKAYQEFGLSITLPAPRLNYEIPPNIADDQGSSDYSYPGHIHAVDDHDFTNVERFYFHPDHLGSSSYITNLAGDVTQHMEYLPFGELLVDEHQNSNNTPFKFNGKEFDEETGNYYYGARYYNPKWSIWLSVDPLAEEMPSWSSYAYTFQNPIRYTDPTGMIGEDWIYNKTTEEYYYDKDITDPSQINDENLEYVGPSHNNDVAAHYKENHPIKSFLGIAPTYGKHNGSVPHEIQEDPETMADRWKNGNIAEQSIYETLNALSVTIQSLNPLDNQVTTLNGEGLNGTDRSEYGATAAATLLPMGSLKIAAGPTRNWIRGIIKPHPSYSKFWSTKTKWSISWGASPARNGKYLNEIPSSTLRALNIKLRKTRIPLIKSWRSLDRGHFHIKL